MFSAEVEHMCDNMCFARALLDIFSAKYFQRLGSNDFGWPKSFCATLSEFKATNQSSLSPLSRCSGRLPIYLLFINPFASFLKISTSKRACSDKANSQKEFYYAYI
jgi:hypothetical protein